MPADADLSTEATDPLTAASADAIRAIMARRQAARAKSGGGSAGEIEIAPDEADAVTLFFSLGSQWRLHPMAAVRLGLDHQSIPPTAAMLGITMTPDLFHDLSLMERAAMAVWDRK